MKAAWIVQGIGYVILLGAIVYILAPKEKEELVPEEAPEAVYNTVTEQEEAIIDNEEGMELRSPAFASKGTIPSKYTCDGDNISPPLAIDFIPRGTVSLALIVEDPDVPRTIREDGMWDHWVVFNIPPFTSRVGEGEAPAGRAGVTTNGVLTYGGPCPPDGEHRYMFRVYALDTMLDLEEGATKQDVLEALDSHMIENATLEGRYTRIDT